MSFLFGPSYPEQAASEVDGREFDYVIVGGEPASLTPFPTDHLIR